MTLHRIFTRRVLPVLLSAVCAPPHAAAQTDYSVFPLGDGASTVLVVPGDGVVTLYLTRSGAVPRKPEALQIGLTPFVDARGQSVPAALLLPGEMANNGVETSGPRTVTIDQAQVPLRLHVGSIPSPRNLSGHLLLSRDGALIKSYAITLAGRTSDRGAKLRLDRTAVTVQAVEPLPFFGAEPARFSVSVRDDSGDWQLTGLHARLEEATGPDNAFDPQRDVEFSVNGREVPDFWGLDETSGNDPRRAVPPEGQATVQGVLPNLPAGQYTAKIRFLAANSQADPGQVLTLQVNVRKSLGYAITLLLLGIIVSLVVTVVLKSRAAILRLRLRILQTRPSWLTDEPSTLVVTWVKSIFNQADALRQFFTVAATDILNERVTQASQHLPYLEQISRLRREIDAKGWHRMVRRRAHKELQRIARRLVPGPLDEKTGSSIQADLDRLHAWFKEDYADRYWDHLKKDIDTLLSTVDPDAFEAQCAQLADELRKQLAEARPQSVPGMVEIEERYATLKLLWERRHDKKHVNGLVALWNKKAPIEDLFLFADKSAWEKLTERPGTVRFVSPVHTSVEPFEPFQPLVFKVAAEPPMLSDNYLFKHKLRYHWNIALRPRRKLSLRSMLTKVPGFRAWQHEHIPPLTPETQEPHVVQYAPRKCTMTGSVVLRYDDGGTLRVADGPEGRSPFQVVVAGSAFKRLMRSVETAEMLSLGMAIGVGVASGLLTQYFGNSAFGSARDCIALFLWGAGADQASKSFVDVLNRFPRWQGTGGAAAEATKPTGDQANQPSSMPARPAASTGGGNEAGRGEGRGESSRAPLSAAGGIAPTQAPPV